MYIYEKNYFYQNVINISEDRINEIESLIENCYDYFSIPKKDGYREICAIRKPSILYNAQRDLKKFFDKIPISSAAKGFRKEQSYFDFLKPHISKKYFMRIDIKDFFGSINGEMIFNSLEKYCKFEDILQHIVNLCTINNQLPQGAVTSPVLSNIVFARVDQRIIKYCQSLYSNYVSEDDKINDIVYTRYADDMLFSSDYFDFKKNSYFLKVIKKILIQNGYNINYDKMKFGYERISLSGFVVEHDVHLSRKKVKEINSILFYFDKRGNITEKPYKVSNAKIREEDMLTKLSVIKSFQSICQLLDYLCGYRAFLISVCKANMHTDNKTKQHQKRIEKVELLVDELVKIL